MGNSSGPTTLSFSIARQFSERQQELGLSLRQIASAADVSRMTVSRALNGDNSISVDNFMAISHALKLSAWKVYRNAELEAQAANVDVYRAQADDARAYTAVAEAKLRAVLQGNYAPAARRHEPDPYEGIGEENQDKEEN